MQLLLTSVWLALRAPGTTRRGPLYTSSEACTSRGSRISTYTANQQSLKLLVPAHDLCLAWHCMCATTQLQALRWLNIHG